MRNYSDRIKKFIEDRMNVICEISFDNYSMCYIVDITCPYEYRYIAKISYKELAKCFSYEMQKVINNLRFEWQMLITKA